MRRHQHISELGTLLEDFGIRHVIICPGSRNAPLTQLFTARKAFSCHSIVDERSAGYVALGMARQLQEAVVVLTTSGTAVLNLAPAVAEACEQQIPLLVITADRPEEKIKQFNNQRLDQREPFRAFSRGFYQFPLSVPNPLQLSELLEEVRSLVIKALQLPAGPVHMNILLEEPLYEELPPPLEGVDYLGPEVLGTQDAAGASNAHESSHAKAFSDVSFAAGAEIAGLGSVTGDEKILILAGMGVYTERDRGILLRLSESGRVVVIAENIANLPEESFIPNPDLLLAGLDEERRGDLLPDVVLAFGGQVVSKRLKLLLQSAPGEGELRHIEMEGDVAASLEILAEKLQMSSELSLSADFQPSDFQTAWKREQEKSADSSRTKLQSLPHGMLASIHRVMEAAPSGSVMHLGNSSVIRYAQMLPLRRDLIYYSNRGTSGIDGCVSSAVGAAMVSDEMHVLLVGDLSFVYDSNAMWNIHFPVNLKIVVLNDKGGGIFRLLDGPSKMEFFEEYSVTHHPVSPRKLAESFGRTAGFASNEKELEEELSVFFSPENKLDVLEVDTSGSENSRIFKKFLDQKH